MSKALSYKEAQTIIEACIMSEKPLPSLQWLMRKRRSYSWEPIIGAANDFLCARDDFVDTLVIDVKDFAT